MNRLKRAIVSSALIGLCAYGCGETSEPASGGEGGAAGESIAQGGEATTSAGQGADAGAESGGATPGSASGGATGDSGHGGVAAGESGANVGGQALGNGGSAGDDSGDCGSATTALGGAGGAFDGTPATIDYVAPYVAYLGEQQSVIIRGAHFPATATVCFGNQLAASVEVKSSSEIRAVPPVIKTAGHVSVTLGGASAAGHSNAELVVRAHPSYTYSVLSTGVGFQDRHVLYDAERDAVFSYCSWFGDHSPKNPSTINRYTFDEASSAWQRTSSYVPDLWDIGLSPDGKYLLALSKARLWLLDPVTFSSQGYVDFVEPAFGTAGQLGVANDGKVLIRDLGKAYSLVQKAFTPAAFPGAIGIVFSADGSRGVVGDANTSDTVPLSIYDASTGLITPSQAFEYFQLPSLDRTGSRYFSGGNLRDSNLSLIGGVPTILGFMRPDGKRAYDIDGTHRTQIHAYDLVGNGPSFPQLADIVVADEIDGYWLQASLDSRFLFIPGPDKFIVTPVP
jgi:hypothetical protein